jgi:lipopolysaccharide cholinephosphotransferase
VQGAAHKIHLQMLSSAAFDESVGEEVSDGKEHYCYELAGLPGHYGVFAACFEKMCASFSSGRYYAMPVLYGERGFRVYDRQWFAGGAEMEFEGLKIPVPAGWKEALVVSYPEGVYERERQYRPAPPLTERIIDTRRSYRLYTRRYTDALTGGIGGKKVFLFGAGDSLRIWLERYGAGLNVICAFDNAESKWGTNAYGVPVRSPAELPGLLDGNSRLIIASIYHKEISKQLDAMHIRDYFIFIDGWNYRRGL